MTIDEKINQIPSYCQSNEKTLNTYNQNLPHSPNPLMLRKWYAQEIIDAEEKIKNVETALDLTCVCKAGCSGCCKQLIPVSDNEMVVIKNAIDNLSDTEKSLLKSRVNKVCKGLSSNEFKPNSPAVSPPNEQNKLQEQYFNLNLQCPLLDESNKCMIYSVRPTSCWAYRNYGDNSKCKTSYCVDETYQYEFLDASVCLRLYDARKVKRPHGLILLPFALKDIL